MKVYFLWRDTRPRYPRETGPIPAFPVARYDLGMQVMALLLQGRTADRERGPAMEEADPPLPFPAKFPLSRGGQCVPDHSSGEEITAYLPPYVLFSRTGGMFG